MRYLLVLIVVLDQLSKFIVHTTMNLYDSFSVIPYLLNFTYIRNEGIAFGWVFLGGLTCNRTIANRPEFWVSIPAVQVFTVEERSKTLVVCSTCLPD